MNTTSLNQIHQLKLAVIAILVACFALSLGDAIIKQSSLSFTLWQIFIIRSIIAIPFLIFFARIRSHQTRIRPERLSWTLLRSFILVMMWVFYYIALPRVPLSTAAAAYYVLPIFITLFAALFAGDRVGPKGWLAVFIGFVGVLLVLKPRSESFNAYALLPLASAICYALAMIMTRLKCAQEKPMLLSLWMNFTFVAVGTLAIIMIYLWQPTTTIIEANSFMFGDWTSMGFDEWSIMAMLALAMVIGSITAAIAYQTAFSSTIATFDFAYVLFAVLWGFLFFAEVPDLVSVVGIVLIIGGGILAVWR